MKKILCSTLFLSISLVLLGVWTASVSENLENGIIRLHIVANSNSDYDQSIKLKVRDAVTHAATQMGRTLEKKELEEIANRVLNNHGADYNAKVDFGKYEISRRSYEGFILPRGKYTAARVMLGEAKGKNWWCVLSPPLCFSRSALGETEGLSSHLSSEANAAVSTDKVTIKLKALEIVSSLKEMLSNQQK